MRNAGFLLGLTMVFHGAAAAPVGNAFTYQGQLEHQGSPADGSFDLRFELLDAPSGGAVIASQEVLAVPVNDGVFTVQLDFGLAPFPAEATWLQISARPAGQPGYTTLAPRQELTPTPYALHSKSAATWSVIDGDRIWTPSAVGIGENDPAPDVSLHIRDNFEAIRLDGTQPFISFYDGAEYRGYLWMTGDNMYLVNQTTGYLRFGTNGSTKMSINGNGDVGIGTTIPELRLHVSRGDVSGGTFNSNTIAGFERGSGNGYLNILTTSSAESGVLFGDGDFSAQGGIIYNSGSTPDGLQFRTNGNFTQMTIDNAGDVGIGKNNPRRPLHVKSRNGGDEYGIMLERSGSSVTWEVSVFQGRYNWFYDGDTVPVSAILTDGTYTTSDRRLKKNVRRYGDVLQRLNDLTVYSYEAENGPPGDGPALGLMAQEVSGVFPEIVGLNPSRSGEMYYSLNYAKTGVLAIKAIQELSLEVGRRDAAIERLESELAAQQAQTAALEQRLARLEARLPQQ